MVEPAPISLTRRARPLLFAEGRLLAEARGRAVLQLEGSGSFVRLPRHHNGLFALDQLAVCRARLEIGQGGEDGQRARDVGSLVLREGGRKRAVSCGRQREKRDAACGLQQLAARELGRRFVCRHEGCLLLLVWCRAWLGWAA